MWLLGSGIVSYRIPFLRTNSLPTEDDQYEDYVRMVKSANGKTVTIRTLMLG